MSVSPEGLPDYLYNAVHKETGRLRMYVWWESPTPPWQLDPGYVQVRIKVADLPMEKILVTLNANPTVPAEELLIITPLDQLETIYDEEEE